MLYLKKQLILNGQLALFVKKIWNSNHKVGHNKQYSNIVNDIRRFENVESISVPLRNLLKIENLEEECVSNKAVYHKRCRSQYNDQHYQRAIKRAKTDSNIEDEPSSSRKTRSSFDAKNFQNICFLCNESTAEQLYLVTRKWERLQLNCSMKDWL